MRDTPALECTFIIIIIIIIVTIVIVVVVVVVIVKCSICFLEQGTRFFEDGELIFIGIKTNEICTVQLDKEFPCSSHRPRVFHADPVFSGQDVLMEFTEIRPLVMILFLIRYCNRQKTVK